MCYLAVINVHQLEHIQIVQLERPSAPDFFYYISIYQKTTEHKRSIALPGQTKKLLVLKLGSNLPHNVLNNYV